MHIDESTNPIYKNANYRICFQPGEKVMILPDVSEDVANKTFPKGIDRVGMPSGKNYVRTTTNY